LEHRVGDPFRFDPSVKPPAVRYTPHSQGLKTPTIAGDTTCVDVVDKDGNLFSATPSSGWLLGGAFIAGDTGVPLSNRMTVFDLDPLSPNVLAGGKRPRTTLTPTLVLKGRRPRNMKASRPAIAATWPTQKRNDHFSISTRVVASSCRTAVRPARRASRNSSRRPVISSVSRRSNRSAATLTTC